MPRPLSVQHTWKHLRGERGLTQMQSTRFTVWKPSASNTSYTGSSLVGEVQGSRRDPGPPCKWGAWPWSSLQASTGFRGP